MTETERRLWIVGLVVAALVVAALIQTGAVTVALHTIQSAYGYLSTAGA